MKQILWLLVMVSLVATTSYGQTSQPVTTEDLAKQVAALVERLDNAIKVSVEKDAEIASLKATAAASAPESVAKAIKARVESFNTLKASAPLKACRQAHGKALVTQGEKGQLLYAGCII